jgi:hypothetical protein
MDDYGYYILLALWWMVTIPLTHWQWKVRRQQKKEARGFEDSVHELNSVLARSIADLRIKLGEEAADGPHPELAEPDRYTKYRICERRHRIPDDDKFCPVCGLMPLENVSGDPSAPMFNLATIDNDKGLTPELKMLMAENTKMIRELERLRVDVEGEDESWWASDNGPKQTFYRNRVCSHGHKVPDFDQFCPTCGLMSEGDLWAYTLRETKEAIAR